MSEENVETLRRANDAFNRGDKAAWLALNDPDVVMIPAREWPENSPTRGAEALWDFYAQAASAWEERSFELGEAIEAGGIGYQFRGPALKGAASA
jgi:ketosteroid isomerase-like protein